jgi:copper resistance protein B
MVENDGFVRAPAPGAPASETPVDMGAMPRSIEDVREPEGPVTARELALGEIDVEGEPVHDNPFIVFGIFDRLEYQSNEGEAKYVWDAFGFAGRDYNRLWVESEGEGQFDGTLGSADNMLLYNRAITPYWNLQTGVRYVERPEPSPDRWYAVLAAEGLNVYWSGVEADLYLSEEADVSGSFEWEFNEFLTQRLVAQPRFEFNFQAQDVEELDLGAGVTDLEMGLRIRYEIRREFAPYVGVSWQKTVGETATMLPAGAESGAVSFVAGLRAWF